jgi:hypothetical protein
MEIGLVKETNTKEGLYCILISLFLGVVFDRIFFNSPFGISYFVFIGLCIAFFLWSIKGELRLQKSMGWMLLLPIALLSLSYAVFTDDVFYGLNLIIVPSLMIASSILIHNPKQKWDKVDFALEMLKNGIGNVLGNLGKPFGIIRASIKRSGGSELKESRKQVLLGLLISLPLLVVVIMLLSSADMVFNYYLSNITEVFNDIRLEKFIGHSVIILMVTLYIFGYIWGFKKVDESYSIKNGMGAEQDLTIDMPSSAQTWEPITLITVLAVLNIVYLLFSVVQFSYLYGGGAMSLPASFTYAEYARRGFFELSAVTFINFIIVLSCIKFVKRDNRKLIVMLNIFFTVLIIFTLNMLFSANFKLTLYENTYGFTYLRVAVHLFMLLLFILCLIVAAGIWINKVPIVKSLLVASIAMYTIVNYLNIDGFIARKNIERYHATGKIDAYYLASLSHEAVPYILELRDDKDNFIRDIVNKNLKHRVDTLDSQKHLSQFNLSRNRARRLLKESGIN